MSLRTVAPRQLSLLIANCRDAAIFIDQQGTILAVNASTCAMFGYEEAELIGADVRLLMAEPYASQHRGYVRRYEETGEKRAIGRVRSVSAKRKNGEEFPIELTVTDVSDEASITYAAFIRDVSDKVKLQTELIDRERLAAVGTTASMLVHEVGNPLNNMTLQLQALRRRLAKLEELDVGVIEKVDACTAEIERLSRLTQEFRVLSGRRRLSRRRTDVPALIESVLTSYLAKQDSIEIRREFSDPLPELYVDPDKLVQVVLNLCQNAIEAMPSGGVLSVSCARDEEDIVIRVADTGVGMPAQVEVFEPFTTTKPHGTGLGLAICAEILRDHGGSITFEPAEPGTCFNVRLPLSPR